MSWSIEKLWWVPPWARDFIRGSRTSPERHLHVTCRAASVWRSWHGCWVWLKAARRAVWCTTSASHCTLASKSARLTKAFVCLCEASCQWSRVLAVFAPVIHFLQIQHMEDDTTVRSPLIFTFSQLCLAPCAVRSTSKNVIVQVACAYLLIILADNTAVKEIQVYSGINHGSLCVILGLN